MRQIANDPTAKINDEYLHDIQVRHEFELLGLKWHFQIEMSCCGVYGPKDYLALHDVDLIDGEK